MLPQDRAHLLPRKAPALLSWGHIHSPDVHRLAIAHPAVVVGSRVHDAVKAKVLPVERDHLASDRDPVEHGMPPLAIVRQCLRPPPRLPAGSLQLKKDGPGKTKKCRVGKKGT